MNEEVDFVIATAREHMDNAVDHLKKEFLNIRAGKASPAMVRSVMVEYYGSQTPLNQVANVNTPDAMTISIQPWEKSMLKEIERAIMLANLGFNPVNNGEMIIINVPALTEERRKELVKQAKTETENDKVSIRNARKEAMHEIKKLEVSDDVKANAEIDIQELTNKYIQITDDVFVEKEKEIMTV